MRNEKIEAWVTLDKNDTLTNIKNINKGDNKDEKIYFYV